MAVVVLTLTFQEIAVADDAATDPNVLIAQVQQNATRIGELDANVEEISSVSGGAESRRGANVRTVAFNPGAGTLNISFGSGHHRTSWNLNAGLDRWREESGSSVVESSLSERGASPDATIRRYAPVSPSFFFIDEIYAGYVFSIVDREMIDGNPASVLEGAYLGIPQGSRLRLVIEDARGIIRREQEYTTTGTVQTERSYDNYQRFGAAWIPSLITETHKSRGNSVVIRTSLSAISVRGGS